MSDKGASPHGPLPSRSGTKKAAKSWRKHLDGWQLALVAIVIAWGSALVIVPRAAVPRDLPLPRIDPRARLRIAAHDKQLAESVGGRPFNNRIRVLGKTIRDVGAAEVGGDRKRLAVVLDQLKDLSEKTASADLDELPRLRAYQEEAFLQALVEWEGGAEPSDDLTELGGDILQFLASNGFVEDEGRKRKVLMDDLTRRALFKRRWSRITHFAGANLTADIEEERTYYAFFILHPPKPPENASPVGKNEFRGRAILKKIQELSQIDPTYPTDYSTGIVLYHLGAFPSAATAFSRYLTQSPSGPYAVRATNFLKASLDQSDI